jgi:hypothetical protein
MSLRPHGAGIKCFASDWNMFSIFDISWRDPNQFAELCVEVIRTSVAEVPEVVMA